MTMRSRTWWLFIPLAIAALGGVWWARAKAKNARSAASPVLARRDHRPIPVRTALVSAPAAPTVVGATAVTIPSKQAVVRVPPMARFRELGPLVQAVHVVNTDYVEAGTLLVELDPTLFQRSVNDKALARAAAESSLALADALRKENKETRRVELVTAVRELEFRRADDKFRNSDVERLERLYNDDQANLTELLRAAATYAEARFSLTRAVQRERIAQKEMIVGPLRDDANYASAKQRVATASTEHEVVLSYLARSKIVSPLSGFVENLSIVPGMSVQTSEAVATILQVNPIYLKVDFPQERIDRLAVGQRVEVVLDTSPQDTFEGKVVRVPTRLDVQRRILPVLVEVSNPDHRIKVGVSAFVRIDLPQAVAVVPAVGVTNLGNVASAFVVEGGRARIRGIKTGSELPDGLLEIREGLRVGEEVVIFGQQYLQDNDAVDTEWRRWARRD